MQAVWAHRWIVFTLLQNLFNQLLVPTNQHVERGRFSFNSFNAKHLLYKNRAQWDRQQLQISEWHDGLWMWWRLPLWYCSVTFFIPIKSNWFSTRILPVNRITNWKDVIIKYQVFKKKTASSFYQTEKSKNNKLFIQMGHRWPLVINFFILITYETQLRHVTWIRRGTDLGTRQFFRKYRTRHN